jgi:hypothetical protein
VIVAYLGAEDEDDEPVRPAATDEDETEGE